MGAAWWSDDGGADLLGYASGEGRGSLVRVRDARRLTRAPSNLATFDLRAETMFWAVENPSPSISKCLDGGFVSYMFVSLLIDSLILGIRARADGENACSERAERAEAQGFSALGRRGASLGLMSAACRDSGFGRSSAFGYRRCSSQALTPFR